MSIHRYKAYKLVRRLLNPALRSFLAVMSFYAPVRAQTLDPGQLIGSDVLQQQRPATIEVPSNNPASVRLQPALPDLPSTLPPSRLEQILSARAGVRLKQFGYDQLGRGRAVIVPQTGAVQDDYLLGPSDEIIVSLRGQENSRFDVVVDRNGQVTIPRLPPISASGRTLGSFREDLNAAVHRAYVATDVSVSVGRVRQISVLVSGEVGQPGQQLLTGLSSVVDALLLAGGVRKTGSLRNILIVRGGRSYSVDLYSLLTRSSGGSNFRLADGDRIIVPPLGAAVAVAGLIQLPGIYELPAGQKSISARALQQLAGGEMVRGRYRLSLLQLDNEGRTNLALLQDQNARIQGSEILFVQLAADQTSNRATLSGGTGLAGSYPVVEGTRLSAVIGSPGALGPNPYTMFGIVSRKNPRNLMRELVAFSPVSVLSGDENETLQSDDIIRPLSVAEEQLLISAVCTYQAYQTYIQDTARNPVARDNSDAKRNPADGEKDAGANTQNLPGLVNLDATDAAHVEQYRQCSPGDGNARVMSTQLQTGEITTSVQRPLVDRYGDPLPHYFERLSQPNNVSQGAGVVGQPQSARSNDVATQSLGADDGNPASLPNSNLSPQSRPDDDSNLNSSAMNYQDQILRPGEYASNREVKRFSDLAAQLGVSEQVLVNFLIDHQVQLNGAVLGPGKYLVGPNVKLQDLVQAAGGTLNWADSSDVEVISTAINESAGQAVTVRSSLSKAAGNLASYRVRPQDTIRFNPVFTENNGGSVSIQGEVRHPGTFEILRGERLSEVLARAGGLTPSAYPYGTVFLRKSVANLEHDSFQRAAKEAEDQLIVAMTRVGSDKISPDTFTAMQAFITDLRNEKALGRISVVADPSLLVSKPELDPLLEPGDLIYLPARPSTVSVLGQVMQPGSYPYEKGLTVADYINKAGGYSSTSDSSSKYVVLPDGTARKVQTSWLEFGSEALPPGSAIVVPRDVTPLDLRQTIIDASQIFSQFAVSVASIAVLSKQ